ncbi:MAG: hypothetical protein J2P17_18075, partial [Mycobacterium sp.]|nr:hypothetical protein [Mycobacterium sp.]
MTNRVAQIHQPNRLLEAERTAREWSLDKAAWQLIHVAKACDPKRYPEFSAARRQISRLEKGQTKSP